MTKVEVQLEYISFFKDEVKLKFTFFDGTKKIQYGKFVYDYKNANDYIKIKEMFDQFVKENEFHVVPEANVVLSTNEVFNTSLILPKAAASKVNKFVDNDLLDKFGVDYKKKYRTASIVSKYKDGGLCICTSLVSNDLIRKITDIFTTIGLKMKNLTSINFLLHEKAKLGKNETNKIVLYVKDNYTAINVYYGGALVERTVSYHSYKYLTSMNIVQRRKLIRELGLLVVSLIGKNDYQDKDVEFTNVDLYVNDDVLASQFKYENPLKFNYNVVQKGEFATDLFKKYNFLAKPVLAKGFTLVEVAVSVGVFALCATSLITVATMLSTTTRIDANRSNAYNAIEVIAADVQNDPAGMDYIEWGASESKELYFDGSFLRVAEGQEYAAKCSYNGTISEKNGQNYYTLSIKDFKMNGSEDTLLSDITINGISR